MLNRRNTLIALDTREALFNAYIHTNCTALHTVNPGHCYSGRQSLPGHCYKTLNQSERQRRDVHEREICEGPRLSVECVKTWINFVLGNCARPAPAGRKSDQVEQKCQTNRFAGPFYVMIIDDFPGGIKILSAHPQ